jgi:hypothetical protein
MFDTLPRFAVDFLDSAIAWVYSFQPTFEPTVILGTIMSSTHSRNDNQEMC